MGARSVLRAILLPVLLALFLQPLALLNAHPPLAATHPDGIALCDRSATHMHVELGDEHADEQGRPAHKHEPTKHLHDPPIGIDAPSLAIFAPPHAEWGGIALLPAAQPRLKSLFRPPRQA